MSRLDKQFRYLHIELLPNKDKFTISYDCKHTLDSMYSFLVNGGLKIQLEDLGAENLILPQEKKMIENTEVQLPVNKINPKNIVIAWEHYETNYLKKQMNINNIIDDFENGDSDDDEEEDNGVDIENISGFMRFGNIEKDSHYTPWGKFEDENPLSPVKLYDLQVVHLKGFKISDISSDFKKFMSNVEGVAIFGQIDQYCIIVGPAKMYDFKELKYNLESAIYKALLIEKEDIPIKDLDAIYSMVQHKSSELYSNGIENIIIIFPDVDNSVEIIENFSKEDMKSVDDLIERVNNLIVFINGENYV